MITNTTFWYSHYQEKLEVMPTKCLDHVPFHHDCSALVIEFPENPLYFSAGEEVTFKVKLRYYKTYSHLRPTLSLSLHSRNSKSYFFKFLNYIGVFTF